MSEWTHENMKALIQDNRASTQPHIGYFKFTKQPSRHVNTKPHNGKLQLENRLLKFQNG